MPADVGPGTTYSSTIGLLYIVNLIVGTGALALPKAFQGAGWALSIVVLMISCLVSYVPATFIVESLSVDNAVTSSKRRNGEVVEYDDVVISEGGPSTFEISQRIEVSKMATMFLGRAGVIFSYLALDIYLFGDLAIYSTTVNARDLILPAVVIGLPTLISLYTDDVLLLAAVTGSYPGVGVQFIIPCLLVLSARSVAKSQLNFPVPKKHASPFQSSIWPIGIFTWAIFAIVMVTLNIVGFSF